ncbi:MAG: T9SS type A sorting domain-containing protein [Bacteroidetes bacterium]|nr:T9SS type A sorting domain-containing protein [Bacteroidota bacterium]
MTGINYTYSTNATGLTWNSSAVTLGTLSGQDDALEPFNASAVVGWAGFFYGGVWYPAATTKFWVSTNGWVALQNTANAADAAPPSSLPVNSLANNPYRIIAPLWDDLKLHATGGSVTWKNSGGATTRVLVIEWRGVYWGNTGPDTAISFQARIYDNNQTIVANRGKIEFRYKRNGNSTFNVLNASASIGLGGFCANDLYAFTSVAGAPSKTFPENQALASKPNDVGSPSTYAFSPAKHPNGTCATAQPLVFSPNLPVISQIGTTLDSTKASPAPGCGGVVATSDVWFTFTKPANITNFEVFTDSLDCRGANFAVGVEVYTVCGGASIACNLGAAGPAGTNASSYLNLTSQPCAAQQYWVKVFSKDTTYGEGYFRFNIRPPGRTCTYANNITGCGLPYSSPPALSNCGFTNDYDSLFASCHARVQHGEDYVFSYTAPSNQCVNLSLNNTPSASNPGLFIYANGCPAPYLGPAGTEVCYGNASGPGGAPVQFNNVMLTSGQTYYFVIDYDSSGATPCLTGWDLTITVSGGTAAEDLCSNGTASIPITISSSCVGSINYNNSCATPSAAATVPLPGCGNFTDGITPDVWLRFTSNAVITTPYQINVDLGSAPAAQDLAMQIYTGTCPGAFVAVPGACDDNSNGLMPSVSFLPTASTNYFIRLWSNNGTKPGNFKVCVLSGCTPPNDLCAGVITLAVAQPVVGDNGCSTGTSEPNNNSLSGVNSTCWTNSGGAGQIQTVWYNFVATNAQMRIRLRLLTLFDSQMALYSSTGAGANTCAGTFNQIFCNDNGPNTCGAGGTIRWSEITATGLTIGNTYFLRVDGLNGNTGTFELTLEDGVNPFPPINVQDCALAQNICSGSPLTVADPGYQGTGNVCDMNTGGSTCMAAGERGSAWFLWSMTGAAGTGTDMNFLITPNSPNDYDFVVYVVDTFGTAACPTCTDGVPAVANYCSQVANSSAFPAVSCNWSACGITGCNTSAGTLAIPGGYYQGGGGAPCLVPAIHVPPGMTATFLLQTSNYTTSTAGFTLSFGAAAAAQMVTTPVSMTWTGPAVGINTVWTLVNNWIPNNCGTLPSCGNGVAAIIGTGASQPVITWPQNVKDITINAGATLTISAGINLQVCGNFTNNGTLTCGVGATVTFIGALPQNINGAFGSASNNFYNLIINKTAGTTITFNTNIYCQGNFSVLTGIANVNSKNIEVGGNFYNVNGNTSFTGLGAGALASTLTFTRRSTVNQLFQNDGANLILNNVSMRQLVAGGTLTLNANATSDLIIGAFGTLSMGIGGLGQEGVIVTPAGTAREVSVLNSVAAACNAGCASSYVSGKLRRAIATAANSYDFPVGLLGTGYERANITYTAAPTGTYNLLAQFKTWNGTNCAFPAGFGPAASECIIATYAALPYFNHGYWNIDASIGAPTGTYTATMYNVGMSNNTGMGWTVVKATSGSCAFALAGNCNAASTAAATIRTNLTGFSDFTTVQSQTPLPIELLSFDARTNNSGVLCSWITATETNNDHFDVERSKTGVTFSKIGEMKGYGAGTSVHNMEYKYQDEDVCTGTLYYRLKQVDIDGRYTYSDIVAVSCKNALLSLAPNPARTNINLNFFEPQAGNITVEVSDIIGQVLLTKAFEIEKGYNDRIVDISSLANGVYYLKIINRNSQPEEVAKQIKFLKY